MTILLFIGVMQCLAVLRKNLMLPPY